MTAVFKTWACSLRRGIFLLHFFPPPICKRLYSSLPLFSLSTSLVRRQETKLLSITKSSKAIWSPVSASRPQCSSTVGRPACYIMLNSVAKKDASTKRHREDSFNWRRCCPLVKQNHHRKRGETFDWSQDEKQFIFCALWLHEEHGGEEERSAAPRVDSFSQLLARAQTLLAKSLRTLSPQNRTVSLNKTELQLRWEHDVHRWTMNRLSH